MKNNAGLPQKYSVHIARNTKDLQAHIGISAWPVPSMDLLHARSR